MRATAVTLMMSLMALIGCGRSSSNNGGRVDFTASGEALALNGYPFPPTQTGTCAVLFVDGWEVKFDELLVTFDNVTLSENPDLSPTDESQTGPMVAKVTGPWAVDLHKDGGLAGKGSCGERSINLTTLANQNLNRNRPFDETKRYAFGFDVVPATNSANKLNITGTGLSDYAQMVQNGWTVLYVGTATFKGGTTCTSTIPSYRFDQLPTIVKFKFGFKSPTTYVNCQNPDNDPARPFPGEEHQRGIQILTNTTVTAQATVHTDHPFWDSFVHDSPLHFDQLAARAQRQPDGTWQVTLDDVALANFTAFTDRNDVPLPWRTCSPSDFAPPAGFPQMHFASEGIQYHPSGDPSQFLRNYADYMTYAQSTQGHFNADGLCYVKRNYPSPP